MVTHSSTLAWKLPWMEEPGKPQSMGSLRVGETEWLHFHFSLSCIGEGNGNPLQCSCLKNPRGGEAFFWAVFYGVTQNQTRLKRLSSNSSINLVLTIQQVLLSPHTDSNKHYSSLSPFCWWGNQSRQRLRNFCEAIQPESNRTGIQMQNTLKIPCVTTTLHTLDSEVTVWVK